MKATNVQESDAQTGGIELSIRLFPAKVQVVGQPAKLDFEIKCPNDLGAALALLQDLTAHVVQFARQEGSRQLAEANRMVKGPAELGINPERILRS